MARAKMLVTLILESQQHDVEDLKTRLDEGINTMCSVIEEDGISPYLSECKITGEV